MVYRGLFILASLIVTPLLALVGFYFWASAAQKPADQQAELRTYPVAKPDPKPNADGTFTVVTYNIGYLSGLTNNQAVTRSRALFEANLEQAIAALRSLDPDFIALQEIDLASRRSFKMDQVAALADGLNLAQGAIAINWDKNYVPFPYWPPRAHFGRMLSGQAVLSRYPILKQQRIVLDRVAGRPFFYRAFYLDRLAQVTEIDLAGQTLILINLHLEAFDEPTRRKQTLAVLELAESYIAEGYPLLLLGDFNSVPPSATVTNPTIQLLLNLPNLKSVVPRSKLGDRAQATFPADRPEVKLDYIFYTPDQIEPVDWQVVSAAGQASDHLPLMFRFRLRSR